MAGPDLRPALVFDHVNDAAIAVNEQRMALGQKSVVSSDQFGPIPDANPGELMKWLPGANVGWIYNGRVFRQREDIAATATNPAVVGFRCYPPCSTVDFNLEYAVTRWAKLFVSGRNITNARKVRYRVVEGAPDWSNFQIANSLGASYTFGVTGTF